MKVWKKKRGIITFLLAFMLISGVVTTNVQAKGFGGEVVVIIEDKEYRITTYFMDSQGNMLSSNVIEKVSGEGNTYVSAIPNIPGYVYEGYYTSEEGSLLNLSQGIPNLLLTGDDMQKNVYVVFEIDETQWMLW